MSITMHTGRPGTGKTYSLTRDVLKALNNGWIVYANYKIFWNGYEEKKTLWKKLLMFIGLKKEWKKYPSSNLKRWRKLSDLINVEDGIIAMDEAHIYMRSRNWEKLPEEWERKLAQHRKDGLHIWGTAQDIKRIDTIFRELVDYWFIYESGFGYFKRWEFNIDNDKAKRFPMSKKFIWKRKKFYNAYDTLEKIKNESNQ